MVMLFTLCIGNLIVNAQSNSQPVQQTPAPTNKMKNEIQKQCLPNKEDKEGETACDCAIGDEAVDDFINTHSVLGRADSSDKSISKEDIEVFILSRPAPIYPAVAKAARVQGEVKVQIVIDEAGQVVAARVVSGHPLLRLPTLKAACLARFKPVLFSGKPVNLSGVITYNFKLELK